MKFTCSILFFFLFIASFAQDFEMDDSVKLIYKPTNSSTPPHENFQFINNSGDSLPVRWRVNQSLTFYPAQWQLALQDNETYHNPIIDSNDIVIPDSAGAMDKIIINVFHNAYAGYGELVIDLINLDSVQEIHRIKFEIEIYEAHNSIEENQPIRPLTIYPNPANDIIHFALPPEGIRQLQIFNVSGQLISDPVPIVSEFEAYFSISPLASGLYQLVVLTAENAWMTGTFLVP